MIDNLVFIFGGILSGTVLGLIGAGSGIVAVVILVYLLKTPIHQAIIVALVSTAISAASGSIKNAFNKALDYHTIAFVSISGFFFVPIGTKLSLATSKSYLEILYALLTLIICYIMWKNSKKQDVVKEEFIDLSKKYKRKDIRKYIFIGSITGFLSGFLGFSGGVIIVPGLVIFLKQSMKKATANSIAIIAITAFSSIISHHLMGNHINYKTAIFFAIGGTIGVYLGNALQKLASNQKLKQAFAIFLATLGTSILIKRLISLLID